MLFHSNRTEAGLLNHLWNEIVLRERHKQSKDHNPDRWLWAWLSCTEQNGINKQISDAHWFSTKDNPGKDSELGRVQWQADLDYWKHWINEIKKRQKEKEEDEESEEIDTEGSQDISFPEQKGAETSGSGEQHESIAIPEGGGVIHEGGETCVSNETDRWIDSSTEYEIDTLEFIDNASGSGSEDISVEDTDKEWAQTQDNDTEQIHKTKESKGRICKNERERTEASFETNSPKHFQANPNFAEGEM